jgi:hypothetical protein
LLRTTVAERPAVVVALVNGVVVYLLPLVFAGAVALFASDAFCIRCIRLFTSSSSWTSRASG